MHPESPPKLKHNWAGQAVGCCHGGPEIQALKRRTEPRSWILVGMTQSAERLESFPRLPKSPHLGIVFKSYRGPGSNFKYVPI